MTDTATTSTPIKRLVRKGFKDGVLTISVGEDATKPIGSVSFTLAELAEKYLPLFLVEGIMVTAQGEYTKLEGIDAKLAALLQFEKDIKAGTFDFSRKSRGEETPAILLAIMEVRNKGVPEAEARTLDQVEAFYEALDKAGKTKLARRADIMIVRARIEKEREAARIKKAKNATLKDGAVSLDF